MKHTLRIISPILLFLAFNLVSFMAFGQGTTFSYQGQLQNNGGLGNGTYNLQFSLYTTNIGGTAVAGPVTNSAVVVTNGLFTVIIDFGSSVWNGQTNWLQIGVETNNANFFTYLAPRQQVTPTPCAINAEGLSGTLPASQLASIGNTSGGTANFFVGPSGNAGVSGSENTAIGNQAFVSDTSGNQNTAVGYLALLGNTNGSYNTANGAFALYGNTSGSGNTADGFAGLWQNTVGTANTAVGDD